MVWNLSCRGHKIKSSKSLIWSFFYAQNSTSVSLDNLLHFIKYRFNFNRPQPVFQILIVTQVKKYEIILMLITNQIL